MKLLEALLQASAERLAGIAAFYGIPASAQDIRKLSEIKDETASKIASHLLVPANALVAMKGLNDEELLALRLICLAGGGTGVVVEQCHQKLNQLSKKWRRNGAKVIEALLGRGLVFTRREGYRQVYYVPEDLCVVLSDFFVDGIFKTCVVEQVKITPRHRIDTAAPLRHLCLMLSYMRKNEVRLTQAGIMFKKAQKDICSIIEEEDPHIEDGFFPMRYPPRLAFLLYFARTKGLVEERDGVLRVTGRVDEFLNTPCEQWRRELYSYWRQTFISQDTDLLTVLWLIMHSPTGSVVSLGKLIEEMNTLSTSHSCTGLNLRLERNLVEVLEYLGAIEVAAGMNDILIRVSPLGRNLFGSLCAAEVSYDTSVYVQSNFELLVPCSIEPQLLWIIDAFADLVKPDQMMIYRISRHSVYSALVHGYTPEAIERFLVNHSRIPVPQNILYSISHWATSYGRVEFEELLVLKCDSDELADELVHSVKVRPFIRERIGPKYIAVNRDTLDELINVLSEEGYMPRIAVPENVSPQPNT